MKKKKGFQISADMFNDPRLIRLMDIAAFISPAKTKDEKKIRKLDRENVEKRRLGEPVHKESANKNGTLDRDRILTGTSLFGDVPHVTEEDIRLLKEGGFDFLIASNSGEYGRWVLDLCERYGIAVINTDYADVLNESSRTKIINGENGVFSAFKPHPATVGDSCFDEPNCKDYEYISSFFKAYHKDFANRFAFCNLFPAGAVKAQLGLRPYREYVDRFSKTVDTDYISVDIYPFHPAKIINQYEMAICLNTYHCVGDACRRGGKDFWLYIQTQGRWFSHLYTMTTYEMIKWQVYASLCYGCRSIIHASFNPVWGNDAVGMIDYNGNLTEQYLYAKRVNAEIAALSPVLKDYRSLGVEPVTGKKPNPHFLLAFPYQRYCNKKQGFIKRPHCVQNISAEGALLVGYFSNQNGEPAFMLVNCKNIYDPYAAQSVTVTLDEAYSVTVYERGKPVRQFVSSIVPLMPGSCDGVFVTLKRI